MPVIAMDDSSWMVTYEADPIKVKFVLSHDQLIITPVVGAYRTQRGLVFEQGNDSFPLYEIALRQRYDLTHWELVQACRGFGSEISVPDIEKSSKEQLTQLIINWTFKFMPDDIPAIMDLYEHDPEPIEGPEVDPHLLELMEDMAITDHVNASDLKVWKNDMKAQLVNKLNRQRDAFRKERAKKVAAYRARKAELDTLKRAKNLLSGRQKRQRGPGRAGDGPASKRPRALPPAGPGVCPPTTEPIPVGPAPTPPPEPHVDHPPRLVQIVTPAPRVAENWDVLLVNGGWLRFSETQQRLDSHCGQHGQKCKFDKTLRKCPVGVACAWLAHECQTKEEHDLYKAQVSSAAEKPTRELHRASFTGEAERLGGLHKTILDCEYKASGRRLEPDTIPR